MPPKAKLHKITGKSVIRPPQINSEQPSTSSALPPELEQQIEMELCWCIQQLQTALKSGKLNSKQTQDHTKALNTLMSNSAPLVKKRQVMRLSFGDYRAKMAAEDKKVSKNSTNMKITTPASPSKKSVFLKKSLFASTSGNNFRFNFETSENESNNHDNQGDGCLSENLANVKIETVCEDKQNKFHFEQSNNSFRFNFNVTD